MSPKDDLIKVGVCDYTEAKRLKAALEERGIVIELHADPANCRTGCKPQIEVLAREQDIAGFREFVLEERARDLASIDGGETVAIDTEDGIYDSEKETAKCPACGTEFSTLNKECPECGLGFGIG